MLSVRRSAAPTSRSPDRGRRARSTSGTAMPISAPTSRFSIIASVIVDAEHARRAACRAYSSHADEPPAMPPQTRPFSAAIASSLQQQPARVGRGDLAERERADDQRHRLVAGVAGDAGDDRHQRRQRHHPLDRAFEGADHARREERRAQVQRQPQPAVLGRLPDGREQVLLFAQAGLGQQLGFALFADDVDHLVDRQPADQPVVADRRPAPTPGRSARTPAPPRRRRRAPAASARRDASRPRPSPRAR